MVYSKQDKEYARKTWAGMNKIFGVVALAMFLVAVLSVMWVDADATWFWIRVGITLGVIVIVSALVYAISYGVFGDLFYYDG